MEGLRQWAKRLLKPCPIPMEPLAAELEIVTSPRELPRSTRSKISLRLTNLGNETWHSRGRYRAQIRPRWWDYQHSMVVCEGECCDLTHSVKPGETEVEQLPLIAPSYLGDYHLELELSRLHSFNGSNVGTKTQSPCFVNEDSSRDCDYVKWYRRADLTTNHWLIVGPRTLEEYRELQQAQFNALLDLGITPETGILDVGCGTGKLAEPLIGYLNDRGFYYGVDVGEEAITYCRNRFSRPNFTFLPNQMTTLPIEGVSFDLIVFFSVFTHTYLDETAALLREAKRLLKPEGRMLADVFFSPLVQEQAGRRGAVELNESRFLNEVSSQGLKVERLSSMCHRQWHFTKREFFTVSHS